MSALRHCALSRRSLATLLAVLPSAFFAAACSGTAGEEHHASGTSAILHAIHVAGDINGDGYADVALTSGGPNWNTVPVAYSNFNNNFVPVKNLSAPSFANYSVEPYVTPLGGDFDGNGLWDIALVGGFDPKTQMPWSFIPVAYSQLEVATGLSQWVVPVTPGSVDTTMANEGPFGDLVSIGRAVAGDFNCDGKTDIAVVGRPEWGRIPVAFSNGDGTFTASWINGGDLATTFLFWSSLGGGAQILAGDFDGNGCTDIALTGIPTGPSGVPDSIPVAFSRLQARSGTVAERVFEVTVSAVADFPSYAAQPGALAVAGDFNGDGRADIAVVGADVRAIHVALSNGDGTFQAGAVTQGVGLFPTYATQPGAQVFAGDINGDGRVDLGLTGGKNWNTVPVALSQVTILSGGVVGGSFIVSNNSVPNFPIYAQQDVSNGNASYGATAISASSAHHPFQ
jgi:hypothetical protein